MKVLDLFSGIGGFSLGLEWAGMSTVAFCERDPYCTTILKKHWPDTPVHSDVRNLDGKDYANSIDVVCGGFPCQPFSTAGLKRGSEDDRHLWPEMLRVIRESKPRWVIGENVSGFINMALDDVSLDLESEGYEVRPFVLPACAVDARHRRDRVFIIAHVAHTDEHRLEEHGHGEPAEFSKASQRPTHVAHAHNEGLQGWSQTRDSASEGEITIEQSSRFGESCRGRYWPAEPTIPRMAHGVPNRVDRVKALGNAVVPQLIQAIGELVLAADKEIYGCK